MFFALNEQRMQSQYQFIDADCGCVEKFTIIWTSTEVYPEIARKKTSVEHTTLTVETGLTSTFLVNDHFNH